MRKALAAAMVVLALGAGGLGARFALHHAAPEAAAEHPPATPAIPVSVGVVTLRNLPMLLRGIGTVQAFNTDTIRSRVDGEIVGVHFVEGQEITAGTLLFQIDPRPYQAALTQAASAKAKDAAQLLSAEADLARYSRLLSSGFQTRQSYDQQKALVAQVQAMVAGDQAAVDTAELNLDYTRIRAPIAGRLGAQLVDVGNLVHASDNTPLVTINQVRPIFVSFALPQQTLDQIRQRQTAAPLKVEALSRDDKQVLAQGRLTFIDNAIDTTTGTIRLKAQFANQNERLWPGEFVNVRVVLGVREAVPAVPAQTVQQGPDGYFVYVVRPDDTVERRGVVVATIQDGVALVSKGLAPGDHVVVNGQYRLTDGARIAPQPAPPPAPKEAKIAG